MNLYKIKWDNSKVQVYQRPLQSQSITKQEWEKCRTESIQEERRIGKYIQAESFENAIDKLNLLTLEYHKIESLELIDTNIKIL